MHMLKRAMVVAAAALAVTGVASASASARALYEADGVTVAPNGTTFNASGTVKLSNSLLTNTCTLGLGGNVTDNGATGSTLTASLPTVTFSSCNFTTTANNLPWTLKLPQTGNPGTIDGADVTVNVFGSTCKFHQDATHVAHGTWSNGSPSTVALSGSLVLYSGPAFSCGSSGTISGSVKITSTSTPGNNLLILPAP